MEKIKIPTSFNIELEFETPEFHKRLFAWLIDFTIIYTYSIIFRFVMMQFFAGHKSSDNNMPFLYNMSGLYLLLYVPILIYHPFF